MRELNRIHQTLGKLLESNERIERDVAEIRTGNERSRNYAQETRRRVDRNTTFARGAAWTGGAVLTVVVAAVAFWRNSGAG